MAQRTRNNPPFGWKVTGLIIDDLTELFTNSITDIQGLTDVSSEIQDLIDNTDVGGTVVLPNGLLLVSNQVNIDKEIKIIGSGTTIKTSSGIKVFNIDSDNVTIQDLNFVNLGSKVVSQYGIFVNSKNNFKIHNCKFNDLYHGISFESTILTGANVTSEISNCHFESNTYGILGGVRGEYVNIVGCRGYLNTNHIEFAGGNININSCILTKGTNGINVLSGANDSHGIINGCEINHQSGNALYFDSIVNGHTVSSTHIFQGKIHLKDCTGVAIRNVMMDITDFRFENAVGSVFSNNRHSSAYANTVDKSYNGAAASVVIANDNYILNGTAYTGI